MGTNKESLIRHHTLALDYSKDKLKHVMKKKPPAIKKPKDVEHLKEIINGHKTLIAEYKKVIKSVVGHIDYHQIAILKKLPSNETGQEIKRLRDNYSLKNTFLSADKIEDFR